jgi:hypothetical protein
LGKQVPDGGIRRPPLTHIMIKREIVLQIHPEPIGAEEMMGFFRVWGADVGMLGQPSI